MTTTTKVSPISLILTFLASQDLGATTAKISDEIKLSPSRTREILAAGLKAGQVERAPVEPGSKTFVYFVKPTNGKKAKLPKARIKGFAKATSGKGNPNAKKIVNPQPTLELKKLAIRKAEGKMVWSNRVWNITVGKNSVTLASRELAAMTVGDLCKKLEIEAPTADVA